MNTALFRCAGQHAPRVRFALVLLAIVGVLTPESAHAQSALHTIQGSGSPAGAGSAVVFLPDVDGDGVREFAVGSPLEAPSGVVRVHNGANGSEMQSFSGATAGAQFGFALAVVHDLDGGGLPDLMIGAPGTTWSHASQGTAYVFSLETGQRWAQIFGSGTNARMGHAVANIGDVDGDGVDDFAASEPGADSAGLVDNGAVVVVSGATLNFIGTLRGNEPGEQFGFALSAWGDLDADGDAEWLVGAPFHSSAGVGGGRVAVVAGGTHTAMWSFFGGHQGEHFGMAVLGLGDTDADGVLDLVVGAPEHALGVPNCGRIALFSGLSTSPREERIGQNGERLGRAFALADWSGDGPLELAVGCPGWLAGTSGRIGAVQLFAAHDLAPSGALFGVQANGEFGCALAAGVDLNGDGAHELIVGANAELAQRGVARVLLGDTPLPQSSCTAKVTSIGCTPRIAGIGAASSSVGSGLTVFASGVTPNAPGMLFFGFAPKSAPFHGGTLCVAQPIRRTAVQQASVGAAGCSSTLEFTFTPERVVEFELAVGTQVHAQFWWRDSGFAAPDNVGLSDALSFVVVP